jgi:hypothetical protein
LCSRTETSEAAAVVEATVSATSPTPSKPSIRTITHFLVSQPSSTSVSLERKTPPAKAGNSKPQPAYVGFWTSEDDAKARAMNKSFGSLLKEPAVGQKWTAAELQLLDFVLMVERATGTKAIRDRFLFIGRRKKALSPEVELYDRSYQQFKDKLKEWTPGSSAK